MKRRRIAGVVCILIAAGALLGGVIVVLDKGNSDSAEISIPQVGDSEDVIIPESRQQVDWEEVTDLNEDGEYNVLDLIIFVQEGE